MFSMFKKNTNQQQIQQQYPNITQQEAQQILSNLNYRTIADLIYKDDNHPDLNVEQEQQKKIYLKTNCFLNEDGLICLYKEEDEMSWEDENSQYEEDEIDKQIYDQMYKEMQQDMQEEIIEHHNNEDREYFQPIQGKEDEWETDSENEQQ